MKNKFKRQLMTKFHWWDHSYFLELMETWLREASRMHSTKGQFIGSNKVARQMLIAATLCKRIREDDYKNPFWFGEVTIKTSLDLSYTKGKVWFIHKPNKKVFKYCMKKQAKQKQADLEMLTGIINKNLFGWWD